MKGFAKTITVDHLRVRIVVFPTVAKVRMQDYREVGHLVSSIAGGYDCVRRGKIVAHADEPREAVEQLVREYNAERKALASASGAA